MLRHFLLLLLLSTLIFDSAFAARTSRSRKKGEAKLGIYYSAMGDPFPSLTGLNLAYNVFSFARLHAGYGVSRSSSGKSSAYGGGMYIYPFPKWGFRPFGHVGYAKVTGLANGVAFEGFQGAYTQNIGSFSSNSDSNIYYGGGMELKMGHKDKFFMAGGYNQSNKAGIGGLGFFNIGMFF